MKLTLEELGALNVLLSSTTLKDLIKAAQRGYELVSEADTTSDSAELALLCTYVLTSI